jgi:hypothetical protein
MVRVLIIDDDPDFCHGLSQSRLYALMKKIPSDPCQAKRRQILIAIVFLPGGKPVPPAQETDRLG